MITARLFFCLIPLCFSVVACGEDAPAADPAALLAALQPAAATATAAPEPTRPDTEEAIFSAFAAAAQRHDLLGMSALCSAELGADLQQYHGRNDARFWTRAEQLSARIREGFEITLRQDVPSHERWRALLAFSDGDHDTVEFSREDGKLVIAAL